LVIGGSGSVIELERALLTLCFGVASHVKCSAVDVLGRAAALPRGGRWHSSTVYNLLLRARRL
jgi:hypothetical protein